MNNLELRLQNIAATTARRQIPSCDWDLYADAIIAERRAIEADIARTDPPTAETRRMVDHFRRTGFLQMPLAIDPSYRQVLLNYLNRQPAYAGPHIFSAGGARRPISELMKVSQFACYSTDQLLRAPNLIDFFNSPAIIDIVECYLGCVPTLYSVNAWWSFPAAAPEAENAQYFHRDNDDWRFCTLFVYLTDVDAESGPHQMIERSHTESGMDRLLAKARERGRNTGDFTARGSFFSHFGTEFSATCEQLFDDDISTVTGPAGSAFLVNTVAMHRGLVPRSKPRLMLWARYGLGSNSNSADLEQGPTSHVLAATAMKATPRRRFINRLLLDFDRGPYFASQAPQDTSKIEIA